jgi:hypothetical protein
MKMYAGLESIGPHVLELGMGYRYVVRFSGGLGLKILVARRQRGPTHNYKAII